MRKGLRFPVALFAGLVAACTMAATAGAWAQAAVPALAPPPSVAGIWEGTLDAGGQRLRVLFHITQAPKGGLSATMDSPDQGAAGIPVSGVTFEKGDLRLEVEAVGGTYFAEMAKDGTLQGTWSQNGATLPLNLQRAAGGAAVTWRPQEPEPPSYVKPETFTERKISVVSDEFRLPGKICMPKGPGPFPGVVLVQGSGPSDMDESVGGVKVFADLAQGLASQGIAVLRYDKRTYAYRLEMEETQRKNLTVKEEVLDDALAAVSLLRRTPGVDPKRVFLLGHSLGAYLAPRLGKEDPHLKGLILLAGNTRPLEDLILEQMEYLTKGAALSPAEKTHMGALKAEVARVKSPNLSPDTPPSELPFGVDADYWLDLRKYDPVTTAQTLSMPMLILQGGRDYQVTTKDFDGWKRGLAGRKNVTFRFYPACNHLFVKGSGPCSPAEYEQPGHVSGTVVKDVATWILGQR